LNERANCSIQIGWIKRAQDMEIYVPSREVQILKRVSNANHGPLTEEAIRRLFERIIDESRSIERVVCSRASKKEASSTRARRGRRQRKNRGRGKTQTRGGSRK
jgi:chorismate mutase